MLCIVTATPPYRFSVTRGRCSRGTDPGQRGNCRKGKVYPCPHLFLVSCDEIQSSWNTPSEHRLLYLPQEPGRAASLETSSAWGRARCLGPGACCLQMLLPGKQPLKPRRPTADSRFPPATPGSSYLVPAARQARVSFRQDTLHPQEERPL